MCLHYLFILSQHTHDIHPKLGFCFTLNIQRSVNMLHIHHNYCTGYRSSGWGVIYWEELSDANMVLSKLNKHVNIWEKLQLL